MRNAIATIIFLTSALSMIVGCTQHQRDAISQSWDRGTNPNNGETLQEAPTPRISPKTHFAAGAMLEHQGNYRQAIRQYRKAIAIAPDMSKAYNRLGIIYERLQQFDEAEQIFKQALHTAEDSPALRNNLGFCYLMKNNYEEAEQQFRAALALSPKFTRARMNLAISLARTQHLEDSAMEFSHAVPKEVAYYNVAVICTDMKDYVNAEKGFRKSLAVNANYTPARKQLSHVRMLAKLAKIAKPTGRNDGNATTPDNVEQDDFLRTTVPLAGHTDHDTSDPP